MWEKAEKKLIKDKHLKSLIVAHGPCRIKPSKPNQYYRDLVSSIVSQQLSTKAAETIFNRVKKGLGGNIDPNKIFKTSAKDLRSWGLSRQKAVYVKDLSEKVREKEMILEDIDKLKDETVIENLTKVKGIGNWSAKMFLMFSLARPDVFPVEDLGIRKGLKIILNKDIITQDMVQYAKRWRPYRSVASWYIWRAID